MYPMTGPAPSSVDNTPVVIGEPPRSRNRFGIFHAVTSPPALHFIGYKIVGVDKCFHPGQETLSTK